MSFFPDGKRILLGLRGDNEDRPRVLILNLEDGSSRPVTPPGYTALRHWLAPDGKRFVAQRFPDGEHVLFTLGGGEPVPIAGLGPAAPGTIRDIPLRWTDDGKGLFVLRRQLTSAEIRRLALDSGRLELVGEVKPPDPAGVTRIGDVMLTGDGKGWVYSYSTQLSELFLAEGLR